MLPIPAIPNPSQDAMFAALPETPDRPVRTNVIRTLDAIRLIARMGGGQAACEEAARHFSGIRGFSPESLARKFRLFCAGDPAQGYAPGDWRLVLDKTCNSNFWQRTRVTLPSATIAYYQSLVACNQRGKAASAWTHLVAQLARWRAGDEQAAIPGYDTPPTNDPGTDLPKGWTEGNFRRHRPTTFESRLIALGPKAAAAYRPKLIGTRVGLEVMQYLQIDDFWHDFMVNVPGARQASRLLQFHAIDLFSACNVTRGFKPALDNEVTGVQERLKEREVLFLLCHQLCSVGYRAAGTTILCESGTSTIRDRERQLLFDMTNGKVTVECGKAYAHQTIAGFFGGETGGNPRFKAALESSGNLLHNRMADMLDFPGQVGLNSRTAKPEEIERRRQHNDALLAAMTALPKHIAERLQLDFLSLSEAILLVNKITALINDRRQHNLEGWREAGLIVQEWRPGTQCEFKPLSELQALPSGERQAMATYVRHTPNLTRERAMSPLEVFDSARGSLVKLPAHCAAIILSDLDGSEITVRNNMIALSVPEIDPDKELIFDPLMRDGRGVKDRLRDGFTAIARINPMDPGELFLYDARNGYLGNVTRVLGANRADEDAMLAEYKRLAKAESELTAPAKRMGTRILKDRIDRLRNNVAALQDPEEAALEAKVREALNA